MNLRKLTYRMFWEELFYNTKIGIKNLVRYFKVVWRMKPWDYSCTMDMMAFQLGLLRHSIANGHEEETSKNKKLKDIDRAIELLNNIHEDDYVKRCGGFSRSLFENEDFYFNFSPNYDSEGKIKSYTLIDKRTDEEKEKDLETMERANRLYLDEWNELWTTIRDGKIYDQGAQSWWD